MEILIISDSPAEGKRLSKALEEQGHASVMRASLLAGKREAERSLGTLDLIICAPDRGNLAEMIALIEYISCLKAERGYHHRPYLVMWAMQITEQAAVRIRSVHGLTVPRTTDIIDLLTFLKVFNDQLKFHRPYILLEHGFRGEQNLHCDEEERLLGISVGCLGPPIPTDLTDKTAVLIDYLCRQKYAKTPEEICDNISAHPFYRAQLKGVRLRETAIKMLICRARKRLAPALAASHAGVKAEHLILNVSGHTRRYKIDAVVKVVHRNMDAATYAC